MIFSVHFIDNLLSIVNQDILIHDLSLSNSLLLSDLLFIGVQVELEGDLNKFNDIPCTFHR